MDHTLLEKAVLAALARGVDSFSGLRKLINVSEEDLRRAVDSLIAKGLVRVERRGFIIKREALVLTEKGFEEARKAVEELERLARKLEERLEAVEDRRLAAQQAASDLADVMALAPLLAWMGLLDLALLAPLGALLAEAASGEPDYDAGEPGAEGFEDLGDEEFAV